MQHARIYRAWLPSVTYSLLFSPFLQHYRTRERLLRATKRGKFSRAAWEFDVVLNSRQQEIPKQKVIQIYHIASRLTQFCAYVRQLKMFQWTRKWGILQYTDQLHITEIVQRKAIVKLWFNCCLRESSLKNYKKSSIHMFSLIAQVYLRLADCRVCKRNWQNG